MEMFRITARLLGTNSTFYIPLHSTSAESAIKDTSLYVIMNLMVYMIEYTHFTFYSLDH